MSDLRKMARDAGFNTEFDDYVIDHWKRFEKFAELIAANVLAQPEQEPVAIALNTGTKQGVKWNCLVEDRTPLYTTPPQRQPLTIEQIVEIWKSCFEDVLSAMRKDQSTQVVFARAIEAAHGIGEKT
jgi:hypothetical protein